MFIKPDWIPILSCITLTIGASPFVVHDEFETTKSEDFKISWLTPYTIVASISFSPGAEIKTFLAPLSMWK